MLNNFIGPVSNLVGTWLNNKKEEKQAKHQAKMNVIQNDANWEQSMAESSKDSWKDEAWTILFIVIIAMCFIPPLQPFVERGFTALEATPSWFQWAMYASIAASFGLRGLKGLKK